MTNGAMKVVVFGATGNSGVALLQALVVRHGNNAGFRAAASVAIRRPRHGKYSRYSPRPASTVSLALAHAKQPVNCMSNH
jgi:hypothetical protein